ncbi:MAG TPA: MFS transporter [Rhodopila sp.]|uniref:MFS transporter n=1 Tax=Rhodopila sp. TaxID=2480087 RepID=UPI002B51D034|nr:MFS transporter [Rhodopila sp.]HVY13883.1 MFS transporter [Rhodopila sp.]
MSLLRAPGFRGYWLALLLNNLASWCVIAALPILVADRFGNGMALVVSLGLRVLPKVVLAPLAGALLRRAGPVRVASVAMGVQALLTASLPWAGSLPLLQALIAAIGTLDLFVTPGLLALRAPVTPPGREMAGNTLYSVADRAAKVVGPALGGMVTAVGAETAFALFALMTMAAATAVLRLVALPFAGGRKARDRTGGVRMFLSLLKDGQIAGLLVAAVTYSVMMGGLRPFLFWANQDWFGGSDSAWTLLLAAQGVGALIGALVSAVFVGRLLRHVSAYTLSLATGLLEGGVHLLLLCAQSAPQAMLLLALAGIPEIVSTAAWFTTVQQRLPVERQAVLFTFSAPLWDLAFAAGTLSAGLHAQGMLSLSGYWAVVSLISSAPLLPLLAFRRTD